jgi:thiamine-phosphate pyrophosphorylase
LRRLSECRLYGIVDLAYVAASDAVRVAEEMIAGGVDLIQLRGKEQSVDLLCEIAAALHEVTARSATPLIANDHIEIGQRVAVEGIHVGQDDPGIEMVRREIGRDILVGKSTHSLRQAKAAQSEGADYVGFGPLFATPTKPAYQPIGLEDVGQVHRDVTLPVFCIGGVKLENLEQVIAAGARRVVIVSGLLRASEIVKYARQVRHMLLSKSEI